MWKRDGCGSTINYHCLKASENGLSVLLAIRLSCDGAFLADPAVLLAKAEYMR